MSVRPLTFSIRSLLVLSFCTAIGVTWWLHWKQAKENNVLRNRLDEAESSLVLHRKLAFLLKKLDSNNPTHEMARLFITKECNSPFFNAANNINGKFVDLGDDAEYYVMTFTAAQGTHYGIPMVAVILSDWELIDIVQTSRERFEFHHPSVVSSEDGSHTLVVKIDSLFNPYSTFRYSINVDGFGPRVSE